MIRQSKNCPVTGKFDFFLIFMLLYSRRQRARQPYSQENLFALDIY